MKQKTLAVWTAIVVVLLAAYLLGRRPASAPPPPVWLVFQRDAVQHIEIDRPAPSKRESVAFDLQEGGNWTRTGDTGTFSYDTQPLFQFLDMVSAISGSDIVSDSPAKYSMFDLEDSAAMKILIRVATRDAIPTIVYAGKRSMDGSFTYMRRAEDLTVRAVRGFERWRADRLFE